MELKTAGAVLVLGAGASADYGFPTGKKLVEDLLNRRDDYVRQISEDWSSGRPDSDPSGPKRRANEARKFIHDLTGSGRRSIDEFIGRNENPEYRTIAQSLVAMSLLRFQADHVAQMNINSPHGWYADLFDWLCPENPTEERAEKLSIITFNYDQSLEINLRRIYCCTYGKSWQEADCFLKKPKIIHIHGCLNQEYLLDPASNIVTCTSANFRPPGVAQQLRLVPPTRPSKATCEVSESLSKQVRAIMLAAKHICFLGYGFHASNNAVLGLDEIRAQDEWKNKAVIATSIGMSEFMEDLQKQIGSTILTSEKDPGCQHAFKWITRYMQQ